VTRRVWIATTMIVLVEGFAFAATEKPAIEGRWEGKLRTGNGDATMAFRFEVKGQVLTGISETPAGSQTIDDGKVNGNRISFNTTVNGNLIKHEGTVSGDTIQLQNAGPFGKFDVVLKRVSSGGNKSAQQ
jgi:hypothetical protein